MKASLKSKPEIFTSDFSPAISDLIDISRIELAADISSKKRALQVVSELLASAQPNLTVDEIFCCLIQRERLGNTAIGGGVATPHGRLEGLHKPVGAFVSISPAINYGSDDDTSVDLLFALLVPVEADQGSIEALSANTKLFYDRDFTNKLRNAKNIETAHALFVAHN